MKEYITQTKTVQVPTRVVCNKCQKTHPKMDTAEYYNLMHEVEVDFSYGSEFEGSHIKFDLCEDCMIELILSMKILPEGFTKCNIDMESGD